MTDLGPSSHPGDVLREAVKREKESILFYQEALKIVTDPGSIKLLNQLIEEETRHVTALEDDLSRGIYPEN